MALGQTVGKQVFDDVGASSSFSFGTGPAVGSTVVVAFWGWHAAGYDASSVTDNQGNSYSLIKPTGAGHSMGVIAFAANVASSGTFTITINHASGTGNYVVATAAEFTGLASSPADQSATASDPGPQANDATVTSGATTQADEVVVAVAAVAVSGSTNIAITTPAGFTNLAVEQNHNAHCGGSADFKIVAATGAQTAAWSHNDVGSSADDGWTAAVLTLKATAVAALFPPFLSREPTTQLRM